MKIVTIYGSPTPPGKLAKGLGLLEKCFINLDPSVKIDRLCPKPTDEFVVGTWSKSDVQTISQADLVIITSPVFRSSLTGTLKLLLDMLPVEALRSKPVGLFTVGAAPQHYLSADRHLRDIMSWFGALIAPNSLFFVDKLFSEGKVDAQTRADLDEFANQMFAISTNLSGFSFGPEPLTLRFTRQISDHK